MVRRTSQRLTVAESSSYTNGSRSPVIASAAQLFTFLTKCVYRNGVGILMPVKTVRVRSLGYALKYIPVSEYVLTPVSIALKGNDLYCSSTYR